MSTEIHTLVRKRGSCKSKFTSFKQFIINTQNTLADENLATTEKALVITELESRLTRIQGTVNEFDTIQTRLEQLIDDAQLNEQYAERQTIEDSQFKYEAIAKQLLGDVKRRIDTPTEQIVEENVENKPNRSFNLPQIKIPNFNGKFENWVEFRDTFLTLIHNNLQLNDLEKFHYLRTALVDGAIGTLRSIPFTSENYAMAWTHVCKRYENKAMIVMNHIKTIDNLPVLQKESFQDLTNLIDEINKHLNSWNSMQEPREQFETLIIHIIYSKIDKYTRMKWDEHKPTDTLPTWDEFDKFLRSRAEKLYSRDINYTKTEVKQKPVIRALTVTTNACNYCKKDHLIYKCPEFLNLKTGDRIEQIKKLNLCANCLKTSHTTKDCRLGGCRLCRAKHNTLLHLEQGRPSIQPPTRNADPQNATTSVVAMSSRVNQIEEPSISNVILSTLLVQVMDHTGYPFTCRALLDSGSQANFISSRLQKRLQLPVQKVQISVQGITQDSSALEHKCVLTIQSINTAYQRQLSCYVLDSLSTTLPSISMDTSELKIPAHISLADPTFYQPNNVDIIIGAQIFWDLLCVGQYSLGKNMPTLQKTRFGWVIGGSMQLNHENNTVQCHFANTITIDQQLEKFWSIEEISQTKSMSEDDKECERIFTTTTQRAKDGRFIVTIPFKESPDILGNSKDTALRRFYALERKLDQCPELKRQYEHFMTEYEQLNHMEEMKDTSPQIQAEYFLPHHAVMNEASTTTRLRVVFDGSAKTDSGHSLNSIQYAGPNIQEDLISIVLRFRLHNIVVTADIQKMYRQILIHEPQQALQQILWRTSKEQPVKTFKLKTVTYGTASAPFLAIRCLKQLAIDNQQANPIIANTISEDFYVDDLITGASSISEAQDVIQTISTIMQSAGFKLHKWTSNQELKLGNQVLTESSEVHFDTKDSSKILGLYWSSKPDLLMFKINIKSMLTTQITKRQIISELAQIFDPLGMLGPCVILGKIIIQKLWKSQVAWDESIPTEIYTQWITFKEQLPALNEITIRRQAILSKPVNLQVHGFCDASEEAYGACIYLRSMNEEGKIQISLLCSKTRVAPLKTLTIPRLELCSAVLLAQLVQKVINTLHIKIDAIHLWSDSTIALHWIQSEPYKFTIFVANRITQIQGLTRAIDWKHISTKCNPADPLSRGVNPKALIYNEIWWKGPQWLRQPEQQWPFKVLIHISEVPEIKTKFTALHTIQITAILPFNRFSNLTAMKRTVGYCIRFIQNCRKIKAEREMGELTSQEITIAFDYIIRCSQEESFAKEIGQLREGKQISKKGKLTSLSPFIDASGLLRVGGRLQNAHIAYAQKHPKILSNSHPLTKLILIHEHNRLLHVGPQGLIAAIRDQFWPIAIRNLARKVVHECMICYRTKPKLSQTMMGNLPEVRVTPAAPFINVGIDFAGPMLIKNKEGRGWKPIKAYICLFICMSTKALHLEAVTGLSTELFLATLRRFTARRGKPAHIFSDNGTNFVGANRQLNELHKAVLANQDEIMKASSDDNIQWHFIPPNAPNFGGLWEAGVKMTKHHLTRVLGKANVTYEQFYTILTQIEAVLNSRPLTPISNNPNDLEAITPSHFLIGRKITSLPDPSVTHIAENRLSTWQRCQAIQQHFWARWCKEYLSTLQQRHRWKNEDTVVKVGDLVVIKEDNAPVLKWMLGRVLKLFPGEDGIARVMLVKTTRGAIKRPISKICLLPIEQN